MLNTTINSQFTLFAEGLETALIAHHPSASSIRLLPHLHHSEVATSAQ
jgi:hypothetical protein